MNNPGKINEHVKNAIENGICYRKYFIEIKKNSCHPLPGKKER